jgi:hypothetical protein
LLHEVGFAVLRAWQFSAVYRSYTDEAGRMTSGCMQSGELWCFLVFNV